MTTARSAHMPYRYDLEAFNLCHMLSTYVLHSLMQNYVCALVIMGSSRDICNDNRVQIKGSNVMRFEIM